MTQALSDKREQEPVSIVLPAYNNRALLEKYLPFLLQALAERGNADEVIVVDDAGQDDTRQFLQDRYPNVAYLRHTTNGGFGAACNTGIAAARYPYILLLNTDARVSPGFLDPLLRHFADPDVFAVSPHVERPDTHPQCQSLTSFRFRLGYFMLFWQRNPESREVTPVLFCTGACALFDAAKLRAVGGVDLLYRPYYEEDVDLGYVAWKRGWKCLYEPGATVWHEESSTIHRVTTVRRKALISARNKHLFILKNISDTGYLLSYIALALPRGLLWAIKRRDTLYLIGLFHALPRLGEALRARRREARHRKCSDREIALRFHDFTAAIERDIHAGR